MCYWKAHSSIQAPTQTNFEVRCCGHVECMYIWKPGSLVTTRD